MTEPAVPEPIAASAGTDVCYRHPDRPTGLRCSNCDRPICGACSVQGTVGQFCPECARGRGAQKVIPTGGTVATRLRRAAPVTFGIIFLTVGAYLAARFSDAIPVRALVQDNRLVAAGEWWRLFTPALVHGSVAHIAFNMFALYQLGPALEVRYGKLNFLGLYLAAAGSGGALAFHLGSIDDVVVGASGAIFGLFGLWLHSAYRGRNTAFGRSLLSSLWVSLALNVALAFILPGISWQGHLGGLVAGLVVGEFWARAPARVYWMTPLAVAAAAVASVLL